MVVCWTDEAFIYNRTFCHPIVKKFSYRETVTISKSDCQL